jgi:putative transposase
MSHTTSPSTHRRYGMVRVCQEWGLIRSTFYAQPGRRVSPLRESAKRGPKTLYTDEVLTAHIRHVLAASSFLGEGHRKVWARLRAQGTRTSKPRGLRLMRQAKLLAPAGCRAWWDRGSTMARSPLSARIRCGGPMRPAR